MRTPWPSQHRQSTGPRHACIIGNVISVQAVVKRGLAAGSAFFLCVTYRYRAGFGPAYTVMIGRSMSQSRADAWLGTPVTDLLGAIDKSLEKPLRRAAAAPMPRIAAA